jgi:hypothetical protein
MYHFARNVTFSAIDLAMVTQDRPHVIGKALRAVMPLISSGVVRISSPHRVYGIGELEAGLRTLQGGQSSGKVVFEMRDHDIVDVCFPDFSSERPIANMLNRPSFRRSNLTASIRTQRMSLLEDLEAWVETLLVGWYPPEPDI